MKKDKKEEYMVINSYQCTSKMSLEEAKKRAANIVRKNFENGYHPNNYYVCKVVATVEVGKVEIKIT